MPWAGWGASIDLVYTRSSIQAHRARWTTALRPVSVSFLSSSPDRLFVVPPRAAHGSSRGVGPGQAQALIRRGLQAIGPVVESTFRSACSVLSNERIEDPSARPDKRRLLARRMSAPPPPSVTANGTSPTPTAAAATVSILRQHERSVDAHWPVMPAAGDRLERRPAFTADDA